MHDSKIQDKYLTKNNIYKFYIDDIEDIDINDVGVERYRYRYRYRCRYR